MPLYFGFRGSLEFSFDRVKLTLMSIFRISFVAFSGGEDTWIFFFIYLHKILKYFQFQFNYYLIYILRLEVRSLGIFLIIEILQVE